jgi:uncharacterized alkaline shock family protein YloU
MIELVINELSSKWYYSLAGLLIFIISIRLLLSGITQDNRTKHGIIKPAEFGDIKISVETFESLALRIVKQINGIKDVKVKVALGANDITVYTKLLVLPDVTIPAVVGEVQSKIKGYIESTTDVGVREVRVVVDDVASITVSRVQ